MRRTKGLNGRQGLHREQDAQTVERSSRRTRRLHVTKLEQSNGTLRRTKGCQRNSKENKMRKRSKEFQENKPLKCERDLEETTRLKQSRGTLRRPKVINGRRGFQGEQDAQTVERSSWRTSRLNVKGTSRRPEGLNSRKGL